MLTREAVASAYALTEKLDSAGLTLRPVENTPLFALVQASRQPGELLIDTSPGYNPNFEDIDYMANTPVEALGVSVHDMTMDEIAPVVIDAVRGHMVFARTVVAPAVEALAEAVRQSIADQSASSLLGMEVIIDEMPALVTNPLLLTAVGHFSETPFDLPSLGMRLPNQTAAEIREIMSAGTGRLDKDIDEWLAIKGDGWLLNLWRRAFTGEGDASDGGDSFAALLKDSREGLDNAMAIFLIARKLYDAAPLEGTQMSLKAYENLMVEFRNQAGRHLAVAIEIYQTDVKNGVLVKSNTERTITVHSEVYREWIAAGGTNEVLYGNLLVKPVLGSVASINERAGKLLEAWNSHAGMVASAEANRRFERTKQFLAVHFQKQIQEDTDETNVGNAESAYQRFLDLLDGIREKEMECLYSLCLRLICEARFPMTAAFEILDNVETAKRNNPGLDIREAAMIGNAKYIARWVATQFKVGV